MSSSLTSGQSSDTGVVFSSSGGLLGPAGTVVDRSVVEDPRLALLWSFYLSPFVVYVPGGDVHLAMHPSLAGSTYLEPLTSVTDQWTHQTVDFTAALRRLSVEVIGTHPFDWRASQWLRPMPGFISFRRSSASNAAFELRALTDLPVARLAAATGVSRAAFHAWLAGSPPTEEHEQTVTTMIRTLSSVKHAFPEDRAFRLWLYSLAPSRLRDSSRELLRSAIHDINFGVKRRRPLLPLFSTGRGGLAERVDEKLRGFGES